MSARRAPFRPLATGTEKPPKHGAGGMRSMFISMIVLLGIILLWQALTPQASKVEQPAVDVKASARGVINATSWPIRVPNLGPEWRATTARFDKRGGVKTWEVGYVRIDDDSVFVSLAQTGAFGKEKVSDDWEREVTKNGGSNGDITIDGTTWHTFIAPEKNPRTALLPATQGPVAVSVTGLGDKKNLLHIAKAWQDAQPAQ
ncbi:DUF4245 domain-containing protein [Dermatophilus congolensis]|uniref:DUF4245 domain-containing protein n=1 Tax=Dermatophilus congolensis TaxID=1863 RepID=UPI001AAE3F75|nr:DUF4245 domain-containing protein [Dermatophilus congolensis]MBO3143142.1 DUF4245 domain-containing protein [Dermatophilus congolensis]MBO3152128.1 DUF4245 domain-containing protein [Dermatophilus congolensis]MBO3160859.1 DUF4245 domain-containing protein [Dermatophilus congolensis]MBO3163416.1 DUF4245 domain-containing protein [Dermatophilus congolensis]MBO3176966.1 DUF4245 domain-containing protein [Dermatophilus congolensis]